MNLSRKQALSELSEWLYPFLPGEPHPFARQDLSFRDVAYSVGVGGAWPGGSKRPAIARLLEVAIEAGKFNQVLTLVIERGIEYRHSKNPISRTEMEAINDCLLRLNYKIPELLDPQFLNSLGPKPKSEPEVRSKIDKAELARMKSQLLKIAQNEPHRRGYDFQDFLTNLFALFKLAPRGSFRNTGEEIDGSFTFDGETYLLEAKWQNAPVDAASLRSFSAKVGAKAQWTRGLFVSYSGFSAHGLTAFATGASTRVICMSGFDLSRILDIPMDLREVLRRKLRRAAETNESFAAVDELFPELV